jgi:hypothetical protein
MLLRPQLLQFGLGANVIAKSAVKRLYGNKRGIQGSVERDLLRKVQGSVHMLTPKLYRVLHEHPSHEDECCAANDSVPLFA